MQFLSLVEVPYVLFCPKVYKMFGGRTCKGCGIYIPSKEVVDRHKKIYDPGEILVSRLLPPI